MNLKEKNKKYKQLPFGYFIQDDGSVTFKIWAPDAKDVKLHLCKNNLNIDMHNQNGIFSINTNQAEIGDKYKYLVNGELLVPDPYSRYQNNDVHSPSVVYDSKKFNWKHSENWNGLPWEQTSIYELHIGTFTKEGTYKAIIDKLDYLKELGITAIELMPVADFPGQRGWGYDGVLLYAPDRSYGTPDELKELIDEAHKRCLQVFLDVVYNHFGPDGNYLYCYAKSKFFDEKNNTPWGDAINFEEQKVREFYINNALYWLEEYQFDGLRFDAVHAIKDTSKKHILTEIAQSVYQAYKGQRNVHLMLENEDNESKFLKGENSYIAQWNDDSHHALHVGVTGENSGYYIDYNKEQTNKPVAAFISRTFTEGFAYQGDKSPYRKGETRGEASKDLSPNAFINFIQNHDQIGNRAFGDRISSLCSIEEYKAIVAFYLLSPNIPMLYMGEEWAATTPFLYFCDFDEPLSSAVREGRKNEFGKFKEFADPKLRNSIPDPTSDDTFIKSKLNWQEAYSGEHKKINDLYKNLLTLRNNKIVPVIKEINQSLTKSEILNDNALKASWYTKSEKLSVILNLSDKTIKIDTINKASVIYSSINITNEIPPKSVIWMLSQRDRESL